MTGATHKAMRSLKRAGNTTVKAAAVAADRVRRPGSGLVVLLYHRVGARTPMAVDLPAALFDEQMAWLAQRDTVTIDVALDALVASRPDGHSRGDRPDGDGRSDRPIVVTFDDGTADLVDTALPILVRHGIPSLWYLATDFIEHSRPFPHEGVALSWAAVRDAVSTGLVTLGSHTDTHLLLDRVAPAVAAAELDRSCALIAERVGVEARDLAYPKAVRPSAAVESIVRDRFRSAALGGCRGNRFGTTDPHRLSRSAIQTGDAMRYFEHKATGGMALEDRLRVLVNRRRYAGAVT
ncbi:MAG: polysaccharide deacetylase family protein [Ilumatobacteraceae bacterium]